MCVFVGAQWGTDGLIDQELLFLRVLFSQSVVSQLQVFKYTPEVSGLRSSILSP